MVEWYIARVVTTIVLLELLTLPFRPLVEELLSPYIPEGFVMAWECTGIDESIVVFSAVYHARGLGNALKGVAIVELYNVLRVITIILFPSPFLHDLLFRLGGFLVIVLTILFLIRN